MKFDKLIQRLEEGTSPLRRLYHYADISKVASIVTQNKFELTYAKGADASKNKSFKRNFYLSCSTIARGRYATGSNGKFYPNNSHCMIEIDASKISDRYKIVPVDYWYYPGRVYDSTLSSDETEERIVARDHKIPNAKKYIIAVHVYMPPEKEKDTEWDKNRRIHDMKHLNRIAHSGVDYYVYDDIKYFTVLRREKAHKLEGNHQYELNYDGGYPGREDFHTSEDKRLTDAVDWLIDANADIDPKNRERLERQWSWKDLYSTIDSDIHSSKGNVSRPNLRKSLLKLSEYQRKHNKSLEDIVKQAYDRTRENYYK